MRIKTFCPTFECWNLNETEAQQLTDHLTATLGNAWTLQPPDVINDTLRAFLFKNGEPSEEIPGEGFLPTSITGENGFFEDGEALTLEQEPEPLPVGIMGLTTPEPASSVDFYDNTGQYYEYTDTDGETYTGRIMHGEAFPWIDWDTCPDNWEEAEEFIAQQFDNQPPRHRRRK
jgi:hypothetical protein